MANRIPVPPAANGAPLILRGGEILRWILAHEVYVTVETEDLERALMASTLAVAAPTSDAVRARIVGVRRELYAEIGRRALAPAAVEMAGGVTPERPNIGPMAPLAEMPIVRPPAPSYAIAADRRRDDIPF